MLSKNQIREIQQLHQKKQRDEKRLFIAEGVKTVTEILETRPQIISHVFGTKDFLKTTAKKDQGVHHTEITEDELAKISLQAAPNKVVAVCRYLEKTGTASDIGWGFTFYLDDIRDPGNFGTIVRLADWFGIRTVYCSELSCDLYNPKVIQASMGAFLRVHVEYISLMQLIEGNKGMDVYGAVLDGNNIYKEQLGPGIIVIGNEANGISSSSLRLLTKRITIPAGRNNGTESLNAAMAASIIGSEFFRRLPAV